MRERHRIVSSENEELILVDRDDNELGHLSKALCHDGAGVLHRAFSLFLFNDRGELLLQQRSKEKRLWPGFGRTAVAVTRVAASPWKLRRCGVCVMS